MDVKLALLCRTSREATDATAVDWLLARDNDAAPIALDAFLRMTREQQSQLYLETMETAVDMAGQAARFENDVFCAGGCGTLLFPVDELAPATVYRSQCLRTRAYLWDPERACIRAEGIVAAHCPSPACVLAVRLYFRNMIREKRVAHPQAITRRYCTVCRACDTVIVPFKRCARCNIPVYCSPECQKKDWTVHKTVCKPVGTA
jgi:hypothetical protein